MYKYSEIQTVHLEPTERCNASCPMCNRNKNGGEVNQQLTMAELSLDDCKQIFPKKFLKQLNRIYMCGNYGDPGIATDTLEIFEFFREENSRLNFGMNTNGSIRKPKWWADLAKVFNGKGTVRFSIDGLEDTNEVYRIGTDFHKIIENARAFIKAGGNAEWDYLVFDYNEHQIEEAKTLAKLIGFKQLHVKKTARFFKAGTILTEHQIKNIKNNTLLKPPKDKELQNKEVNKFDNIKEKYGSLENYYDKVEIDCKVAKENNVYITAQGLVLPCCWTASRMYLWYEKELQHETWQIINKVGVDNINAKLRPLREIINGPMFQKHFPESWNIRSCEKGRLKVCARICGVEMDVFQSQFE